MFKSKTVSFMDIVKVLSDELGIKEKQIEKTISLIDEGNTIPFIARYRKEVTGALNDEILRNLWTTLFSGHFRNG